jgi:rhomboid protease GluP
MNKKLSRIYLPFLLSALAIPVVYTFCHWLFLIQLQLIDLKEFIVNIGIPLALPSLPILLFLRPRLKLLNLKTKKGSWIDFYTMILWLILSVPNIIAQNYMEKASGKLTELNNIHSIKDYAPSKYYSLKKYYVDKEHIGVYPSVDVSGKHNEDLNMRLHIVLPILDSTADTIQSNCVAWLGLSYSEQISNRLEEKEKEEKYEAFTQHAQDDFDQKDVQEFIYLERVGNTDDGDNFKEAIKKSSKFKGAQAAVFEAINEPFEQRLGNGFTWLWASFGIGALLWLIMILMPKMNQEAIDDANKVDEKKSAEWKEMFRLLQPKEGFWITPLLIYANVAVYLLMVFKGLGFATFKSADLLAWGANYKPLTMHGAWWRLLSSTFLHGGIMHLLANMYGLIFVGIFLEPIMGKTKYLLAYLISGLLASCASIWWYDATVSVGASGAIFGLYGVFLALLLTKTFHPAFAKSFLMSTLIFVGFNLLMGFTGGIDNAAHIGGLISGFIIGLALRPTIQAQSEEAIEDEAIEELP